MQSERKSAERAWERCEMYRGEQVLAIFALLPLALCRRHRAVLTDNVSFVTVAGRANWRTKAARGAERIRGKAGNRERRKAAGERERLAL